MKHLQLSQLKLIMDVAFSHPPGPDWDGSLNRVQRLRLLFTDQTKVVTSAGGQNSVTQMIGSLLDAVEEQYGRVPTRLYRAFREGSVRLLSAYISARKYVQSPSKLFSQGSRTASTATWLKDIVASISQSSYWALHLRIPVPSESVATVQMVVLCHGEKGKVLHSIILFPLNFRAIKRFWAGHIGGLVMICFKKLPLEIQKSSGYEISGNLG